MASGIKFDLSTFRAGLRAKLAVTKKAEADVLNQAGGSVCANTIRLTKKANRAKIQSELQSNGLAFRILQSPHAQRRLPANLRGYTRGTHTRQQINAAAAQLIRQRAASSGYIASGWFNALAVFRPGFDRRPGAKSLASKGQGRRATPSRLVATFENFARGAGEVGAPALQEALNQEGLSMKSYGEARLAKAWK